MMTHLCWAGSVMASDDLPYLSDCPSRTPLGSHEQMTQANTTTKCFLYQTFEPWTLLCTEQII
jgi:hypothetical protein